MNIYIICIIEPSSLGYGVLQMPGKLIALALLAVLLLLSAWAKDAGSLERYLDCAAAKRWM
jgi:hypothetical protein